MVRVITVHSNDGGRVVRRIRDLYENPEDILKKIGAVLVSSSQQAFEDQSFDGEPWAERYPSMDDPFVNVAGLVSDLQDSAKPKGRRFDRRPAGVDNGDLWKSLDPQQAVRTPSAFVVEVGSTQPYASNVMFGGESDLEVTPIVKKRVEKFLGTPEGSPYWFKLFFLTGEITTLTTDQVARPYLGIQDKDVPKIISIVENGPFEVLEMAEDEA